MPLGPEARAVLADLPREDGNPWVSRAPISPISSAPGAASASTPPQRVGGPSGNRQGTPILQQHADIAVLHHVRRRGSGPGAEEGIKYELARIGRVLKDVP